MLLLVLAPVIGHSRAGLYLDYGFPILCLLPREKLHPVLSRGVTQWRCPSVCLFVRLPPRVSQMFSPVKNVSGEKLPLILYRRRRFINHLLTYLLTYVKFRLHSSQASRGRAVNNGVTPVIPCEKLSVSVIYACGGGLPSASINEPHVLQ